ncbi:hypothetical protein BDV32DRAFT_76150 [Aspergillus pseudonomiae]|uniref:Uncharacterized protein n=1 Tax=Aspergillus pseudonomiae TaxID=1506151 RepID=A0A5N7DMM3_9EURO|nr:uncharacterized protein BDV37DRAFT_6560 [Aspergillus pseudonomiae]KAB8258098.1 hypothetical protein BDV32DRAFT_76150 [Aspergillus pseudonomiae]KAE8407692.1 hypothetical protein BDV37DRAFT_6560 [Aspergillus pseudonomiae]
MGGKEIRDPVIHGNPFPTSFQKCRWNSPRNEWAIPSKDGGRQSLTTQGFSMYSRVGQLGALSLSLCHIHDEVIIMSNNDSASVNKRMSIRWIDITVPWFFPRMMIHISPN